MREKSSSVLFRLALQPHRHTLTVSTSHPKSFSTTLSSPSFSSPPPLPPPLSTPPNCIS